MSERVIVCYGVEAPEIEGLCPEIGPVVDALLTTDRRRLNRLPLPHAFEHDELVLVGRGERCADLVAALTEADEAVARRIRALILLAPTAPWAERLQRCGLHHYLHPDESCDAAGHQLPLGPLEPLRVWFERAQTPPTCCEFHASGGHPQDRHGRDSASSVYGTSEDYRRRIIATCHPEVVECLKCDGAGTLAATRPRAFLRDCASCQSTGKALGSHQVVRELSGGMTEWAGRLDTIPTIRTGGSVSILMYPSRVEHDRGASAEALRLI